MSASIEIEAEATGDIDRLPDDEHQRIEQIGQVFQPEPFGAQPEQILPVPALYQLRRQQEIQHAEQAEPERAFQMHADHGQPAGRAAAAQTEREQALLACLAVEPLELLHWQIEAARRAQATPGETGQ